MIARFAFTGIALIGVIVALPRVPVSGAVIAQTAVTPTPPLVIPAWILGGGNFYGGQQVGVSPFSQPDVRFSTLIPEPPQIKVFLRA